MFTPVETTIGALLLHQAATGFLFQTGTVLGASGLLREAMMARARRGLLLLAGMATSFLILGHILPELIPDYPAVRSRQSMALAAVTGVMTGLGTKLSFGCTSGHMLCGLSRLSARSFVAVSTFFPAAVLAFNLFHGSAAPTAVCSLAEPCYTPVYPTWSTIGRLFVLAAGALGLHRTFPHWVLRRHRNRTLAYQLSIFLTGLVFGIGLLVSGMADPGKVSAFFAFPTPRSWDPSLVLVIAFGILPSLAHNRLRGFERVPDLAPRFELPCKGIKDVDWTYVAGAALFGLAWGIGGVCPGPAVLRALAQPVWGLLWMGGFYVGSILGVT